jgi:DNA-binding CsgD family transcriptional regulator
VRHVAAWGFVYAGTTEQSHSSFILIYKGFIMTKHTNRISQGTRRGSDSGDESEDPLSGSSAQITDEIPAQCRMLSKREFQILECLAGGETPKSIADILHLNVKTVYTYRERLRTKLRLKTDQELIRFAIKHKIT